MALLLIMTQAGTGEVRDRGRGGSPGPPDVTCADERAGHVALARTPL